MQSAPSGRRPHLVDEHDGENGLVEEPGFPAVAETRRVSGGGGGGGGGGRHLSQHVAGTGTQCDNSKVGHSAAKFNSRESGHSLHNDIDLGPLAGADGNT